MPTELPIAAYRDDIVEAVEWNPVTVLVGPTGSGKSTQVAQYLHAAGYKVTVTQPRRLAARSVARRVAEEMNTPLGELVGYRTAEEQLCSPKTEIMFCTDGLELLWQLNGRREADGTHVLIIDEVHEWNINIELLVALVKRSLRHRKNIKVVLMSATVDAKGLADYFGDAPVIDVPGRLYPVEKIHMGLSAAHAAASLAAEGRNVLVFVTGKAEIERTIRKLYEALEVPATVLPLHGMLSPKEQQRVFASYEDPLIVVATNVAQTSITIDCIDAVVDTGRQKRREVRDGIEGLFLWDISQADCIQRMGRAGRTKPGMYALCSDTQLEERDEYPTAEILRVRLDQLVLRLASVGLDAASLEFFHQPDPEAIRQAKRSLYLLGAVDAQGAVTEIGRAMNRFPIDTLFARMMVEAQQRGVLEQVMVIVACLQAGSIRGYGKRHPGGGTYTPQWFRKIRRNDSDLLAELEVFVAAQQMSSRERDEFDISAKQYEYALEILAQLRERVDPSDRGPLNDYNDEDVAKACLAGLVEHIYVQADKARYAQCGDSGPRRHLAQYSVVSRTAQVVAGAPFANEHDADGGAKKVTVHSLQYGMVVHPAWLQEVAPNLVTTKSRGYYYSSAQSKVLFGNQLFLDGNLLLDSSTPVKHACPQATAALALAFAQGIAPYAAEEENKWLAAVRDSRLIDDRHKRNVLGQVATIFADRLQMRYTLEQAVGVDLSISPLELHLPDIKELLELVVSRKVRLGEVTVEVVSELRNSSVAAVKIAEQDVAMLPEEWQWPYDISIGTFLAISSEKGKVVAKESSWAALRKRVLSAKDSAVRASEMLLEHIQALEEQAQELSRGGLPVDYLQKLINEAKWCDKVEQRMQLLRKAEREAEHLAEGDFVEIIATYLLEGKLPHPGVSANRTLQAQVLSHRIRSGGEVALLTDETLLEHYRRIAMTAPSARSLRQRSIEYPSAEVLFSEEDMQVLCTMAPQSIEVHTRNSAANYTVKYRMEMIGGEATAVGVVQLPLHVYSLYAAKTKGWTRTLPALPHKIPLFVEVTQGFQVAVRGIHSEALRGQVRKIVKSRGKG